MDIERLRTDPAYWDEVAPKGAEVYIIDDEGIIGPDFYYHDGRVWKGCRPGAGFWDAIDQDYLEVIPRPTQWRGPEGGTTFRIVSNDPKDPRGMVIDPRPTQWRGPEDGLPPVGAEVEVWIENRKVWAKVTVLAVDVDTVVWRNGTDRRSYIGTHVNDLRPLRSDKERAVEAVLKATPCPTLPRTVEAVVGDLYDAGFLRLPEDEA